MARKVIAVKAYDGEDVDKAIDTDPDICPVCHYGIKPRSMGRDVFLDLSSPIIERVFQCPRRSCGHVFIGRYNPLSGYGGDFVLFDCVPYKLSDEDWPSEISDVSPDFCLIAN
jgi:hypothetical protein